MKKTHMLGAAILSAATITLGIAPAHAAEDPTFTEQVCDALPNKLIEADARWETADNVKNDADDAVEDTRSDLGNAMDDVTAAVIDQIDRLDNDGDTEIGQAVIDAAVEDFADAAVAWSDALVDAHDAQVEYDLATLGQSFFDGLDTGLCDS